MIKFDINTLFQYAGGDKVKQMDWKKWLKRNAWHSAGILCGIIVLILGLTIVAQDHGSYGDYYTFGADFYTEVQNTAAKAVSNIYHVYKLMAKSTGYLLISLGLTDICIFGSKLKAVVELKEFSEENNI